MTAGAEGGLAAPRPLPVIDELTRPFWSAAKDRVLVVQRCTGCGRHQLPAVQQCPACGGRELVWVEASGMGSVHTFTVIHQVYHSGFAGDVPYNVTIVELDEGPLMLTNLIVADNAQIKIGSRVRVVFDEVTDEVTLPKFEPVGDDPLARSARPISASNALPGG